MNQFSIAAILPLWTWAVVPRENHNPGIPFYSETGARKFFSETAKHLPWSEFYLVRRVWRWTSWLPHSEVEVIETHEPESFPITQ